METLLEPNVFLITTIKDFCLLLLGNRNGNSEQEKLSPLILIIIYKGFFQFYLSILFSYLEVLTRLCSSDEHSL